MFGNTTIAFLAAIGFAAWLYAKMQRQTGGNTQTALVVASAGGFVVFLLLLIVLGIIF